MMTMMSIWIRLCLKSVAEALNLVDELKKFALAQLHDEDLLASVEIVGKKLEDARLSQHKQSAITDFFFNTTVTFAAH